MARVVRAERLAALGRLARVADAYRGLRVSDRSVVARAAEGVAVQSFFDAVNGVNGIVSLLVRCRNGKLLFEGLRRAVHDI